MNVCNFIKLLNNMKIYLFMKATMHQFLRHVSYAILGILLKVSKEYRDAEKITHCGIDERVSCFA